MTLNYRTNAQARQTDAAAHLPRASYATNAQAGYMGDPKRGAAMGRPSIKPAAPVVAPVRVTLQRVRLNAGGYDQAGAYWGHGAPLYWAATDDGALDTTLRANSRDEAKERVRAIMPGARFAR